MASLPETSLVCDECGKSFTAKRSLVSHKRTHSGVKPFPCEICEKAFSKKSDLKRHEKIHDSSSDRPTCEQCGKSFARKENLLHHKKVMPHCASVKRKASPTSTPVKLAKRTNCVLDVFATYKFIPTDEANKDLNLCFKEQRPRIIEKIEQEVEEQRSVKWYLCTAIQLTRPTGEEETVTGHFRSKCATQLTKESISHDLDEAFSKITQSFEEFVQRGSGWVIDQIQFLELFSAKYRPLAASSYIPLPTKITKKKAVLNIQNEDQKCFIWSLLAHKYKVDRQNIPQRVCHYLKHEDEIKLGNVECPVPISKISNIEKQNDLRINVYGYEKEELFPLYISSQSNSDCINLLLISDDTQQHYCLIRNMSRLLGDLSNHNGASFYCYRCLHRFAEENTLKNHQKYCNEHSPQNIKMPSDEDKILEFKNIHYQQTLPFIIYADFESLITPMSTVEASSTQSYTEKTALHQACGYAYIIVGPDGKSYKPIYVYRGPAAVDHFLNRLIEDKNEIAEILTQTKSLIMTPEQEVDFQQATHCYICKQLLGKDRVRDHNHVTGDYRGALHNACNLKYRLRKIIPVVFHNLKNYDAHLIMQGLGKIQDHQFEVIPSNMEKYISFTVSSQHEKSKVCLQFIDSFQFMASSLEKLATNLNTEDFVILKENITDHTELLIRKGIYPYEYFIDFDKFNETALPPRQAFFSSLTGEFVSEEDYKHAENVWATFQMKNLGDYHDLYVKTDVLLLADIFQNFRQLCKRYYDLDCAHMMTAPGLSWQACLKMTQHPLELLTDIDMHLFFERGIRGGISMICQRWACANNKYLDDYDSEKPSTFITYLDANNLYGWAMSQPLPDKDFEWISPESISVEEILATPDDAPEGFVLEVDLLYPEHLHDSHSDYPLAPEQFNITTDICSPYTKNIMNSTGQHNINCTKLTPNLNDKKHYVIHYRNLKLYLSLGLQLTKVHKIIKFKQSVWLKEYIDFNTEKRKQATSSFEKDFFKLLINAIYGKTMENVRKWIDVLLINDTKKGEKLVAAPTFKAFSVFTPELVAVERVKKTVTLNRPIYVGFSILELSKLHMYKFHYDYIKQQYGNKAHLLFTDTDSLTYEIETEDIFEDMQQNSNLFDTSDYPPSHYLHSKVNKKKLGCFKDELNSEPVKEFVGLRSKMYSILSDNMVKKTAKGVSKSVIKKINHEQYKTCLFNSSITREKQFRLQSMKHQIYSMKINKVALSPYDDKRYILEDGIHTLAHGHYQTKKT